MTKSVEFSLHMTADHARYLRDNLAVLASICSDDVKRFLLESLAGEIEVALHMDPDEEAGRWFSNDDLRRAWISKESQKRANTLEQMARLASLPAVPFEHAMMTVAKASAGVRLT